MLEGKILFEQLGKFECEIQINISFLGCDNGTMVVQENIVSLGDVSLFINWLSCMTSWFSKTNKMKCLYT